MQCRSLSSPAAAVIVLALGLSGAVRAQDAPPTATYELCNYGPQGGGCVHFEGYVYVRRSAAGLDPPAFGRPAPDPGLGGDRLYIHVEGAR